LQGQGKDTPQQNFVSALEKDSFTYTYQNKNDKLSSKKKTLQSSLGY